MDPHGPRWILSPSSSLEEEGDRRARGLDSRPLFKIHKHGLRFQISVGGEYPCLMSNLLTLS